MENNIGATEAERSNFVGVFKKEYEDALNSIENATKLIEEGKNMRGLFTIAQDVNKTSEIRDTLAPLYRLIFNQQDLLQQLNPKCLEGITLLMPSEMLLESPQFKEATDQFGLEKSRDILETHVLDELSQAGFRKEHWLVKPLTLSEIEYMLFVLGKIVEPDFVPLEKTDKGEDEQDTESTRYIPRSVKLAVWRRDLGKCEECGSKEKLEYDHIIPVSKGGSNTERNIQLLCEGCNRKKAAAIGG